MLIQLGRCGADPRILQYLTEKYPRTWVLTWGGLRRKPRETPEQRRLRIFKAKIKRCVEALEAAGIVLDPQTGHFERKRKYTARYDDAPEEAN